MKLRKEVDEKMIRNLYRNTLAFIYFIDYCKSVPIDYCLQPLNKSDCGLKPTPVFSYYKPGSRCEIEFWRGCSTFNKFDNEFLCSHHCIGKLWGRSDDKDVDFKMLSDVIVNVDSETDKCKVPMNEDDCGVEGQFKYTFIGDMCIRVAWKGCESRNLFDDELTCVNTCNTNVDDLKNHLQKLSMDDVQAIDNILNNLMANDTENTDPVKLKKEIAKEETTEAETTVEPEIISEAIETTGEVLETTTIIEKTAEVTETVTELMGTTHEVIEAITEVIGTTPEVTETVTEVTGTTLEVTETTTEVKNATVDITQTTVTAEVTTPDSTITTTDSTAGDPDEVLLPM